jgi:hypothetical protein
MAEDNRTQLDSDARERVLQNIETIKRRREDVHRRLQSADERARQNLHEELQSIDANLDTLNAKLGVEVHPAEVQQNQTMPGD